MYVFLSPLEERLVRSLAREGIHAIVDLCDLLQRYQHGSIFCECRAPSSSHPSKASASLVLSEEERRKKECKRESEREGKR
jgi:hypothetical protein